MKDLLKEDPDAVLKTNAKDEFDTLALYSNGDDKSFALFNKFYLYSNDFKQTHGHIFRNLYNILKRSKKWTEETYGFPISFFGKITPSDRKIFEQMPGKYGVSIDRTNTLAEMPYVIQGRIWTRKKIISFWNSISYIAIRKKDILDFMKKLGENPTEYRFEVNNKLYDYENFISGKYSDSIDLDPTKVHTMPPEQKGSILKKIGAKPKVPVPLAFKLQAQQENINFKNWLIYNNMMTFSEWTSKYVQHAKEWLLELDAVSSFNEFDSQEDYVDYINQLGPEQIKNAVEHHYEGGWKQFIKDAK
jgi:hypothetical protein